MNQNVEQHCKALRDTILNGMKGNPSKVIFDGKSKEKLSIENVSNLEEKVPILYRWLVKEDELNDIIKRIHDKHNPKSTIDLNSLLRKSAKIIGDTTYYALYFGQSKNGQRRILSNHLRGTIHNSTLRRTLCGLCVKEKGTNDKEKEVNKILINSYFEWLSLPNTPQGQVISLETICIAFGNYPLNIEDNPAISNDWAKMLKEGRMK